MPGRQHRVAAGAALLGAAFCGAIGQGAAEDAGRQFRDDFAGGKPELT